jgi:hypothetical protein
MEVASLQEIIQSGHFLIKVKWLVLAVSGLFGYAVMRLRLMKFGNIKNSINDTLINILIIAALIWKFSLILFNPIKVLNNPLAIIYFSGGIHGFLLSLVISAIYLVYCSFKQGISMLTYIDFVISGFLAGTFVYNITALAVSRQFLMFYFSQSILSASLLLWQIKKSGSAGSICNLNQILMWFSLGQIFISHFKAAQENIQSSIWNFSPQQIIFYALSVLTVSLSFILEKKRP